MKFRTLGDTGVSAIGLGAMPMSTAASATATIHAAIAAGVTLIDTADAYAPSGGGQGTNESLVAAALASWGGDRSRIMVATKGGLINRAQGPWAHDARPEVLQRAARASLARLGGDALDLYQLHRADPGVPYPESIGALRDLLDQGIIRRAGISNATIAQIAMANQILGGRLASVQNQFSPTFREGAGELEYCTRHGIAFLAWSPLGGILRASAIGSRTAEFGRVADELGVSPQQVALAWELALGDNVIPIPGVSRVATALDSAAAVDLELTAAHMARLNAAPCVNESAY